MSDDWNATGEPPAALPPFPSPTTVEMMRQTKPWVFFLSILGFVWIGLMIFLGVGGGILGLATGQLQLLVMLLVYVVLAVVYIVPMVYLYRYASRIAEFLRHGRTVELDAALEAQKSFWKYVGILTIVMLALYVLAILAIIVASILMARAHGP